MKISKKLLLLGLMSLAIITSVVSCKDDETVELVGNWIELADFGGDARHEAVAFSIGEIGYVGTGYNGDERLKDFFAYDADMNNWTIIAAPPAEFIARTGAVAFSANGKGYVGTGRDIDSELNDFWAYNPDDNSWTRVADMPIARYGAVAFTINNIGYVGTGYNGSAMLDFYSYDPVGDSWTPISNYPSKVREAVAFVIENKGYVCTGEKNGALIDDFYMYDPAQGIWVAKRKISDESSQSYDDDYSIIRKKAVAFTIGGYGYVCTGDNGSAKNDVWEYDPAADEWTEKSTFESAYGRNSAVAFTTASGRGFVTTGLYGASTYYDDLFEFKPMDESNDED
jgi:N-acetylneuraminic acid mutarotase